jgi:iron complex outermembrane receptor protein
VLINSRRVTGYGFAQNLQDSFVDINSIPSSAVERVEILKDGASAIYGSDAIAGVVNIILRRDFRGIEATASAGRASGHNDYGATLTGGWGDLGTNKFNVFGVLDYYKRGEILLSDTDFGKDRDYRDLSGGRNFTSLTNGGTWRQLTATGGLSNNFQSISQCVEGAITGPEAIDLGLTTNPAVGAATNTFCPQNLNKFLTAIPGTERLGFLSRGTYEISPTVTAFAEVALSRVKTDQSFTNPFFNTTGLNPTPQGLKPFSYTINFAPGVAGNPFATASNGASAPGGATARYSGALNDMGSRDAHIQSDTGRFLAGLLYSFSNWDFDSAVGYSKNKVDADFTNRLSKAGVSAAFGVPTSVQPPVPVSTGSTYQLDDWTLNSDAVRDSLRASDNKRKATSTLKFIDTKATTELPNKFNLPGGAIGLALGAEYRKETLKDRPSDAAINGDILGQGTTATDGHRSSEALYGELRLPLMKNLEMQLAARYDHYSDYGSSTVPKVGIKYTPTDTVALRGNVGKGFRAPSLPEISPSTATFFVAVTDPQAGPLGAPAQISGVFSGNPKLKAEKSTSANLGIVFEPTRNFSTSIDYYWIKWKDIVQGGDFQSIIDASCPNPPADPAVDPPCPSTPQVIRDPVTNQIVTVFAQYENISALYTSGIDLEMRYTVPTASAGKFTARFNGIYVIKYEKDGVGLEGSNGDATNTIPRIKYLAALDWDYGAFSMTTRLNYISGMRQDLLGASFFTPQDPRFQTGVFPEKMSDYYTIDLFGSYQITKNFKIAASVNNLLDKKPPFDPGYDPTLNYDFSQYDVRGRLVRFSLTYKM